LKEVSVFSLPFDVSFNHPAICALNLSSKSRCFRTWKPLCKPQV
jgi:hypothetical protein